MTRPLAYTYFVAGIIFAVSVYLVLRRSSFSLLADIMLIMGYVAAFALWRWLEYWLHSINLRSWRQIRQKGKFIFVLTRYVVLRGLILGALFVVPSLSQMGFQTIAVIAFLIILLTSILGNQEWTDCETKYQANLLHDAATTLRAMQN